MTNLHYSIEIWKDIPTYKGLYQASNTGKIRSVKTGKILKQKYYKGYLNIDLRKDYKITTHRVHRLVMQSFCENPLNKPCVNHLDSIRDNNNLYNLEWCTHKENTLHALKAGRLNGKKTQRTPKHLQKPKGGWHLKDRFNNASSKKVYQYDLNKNLLKIWLSISDIHRSGIAKRDHVSECCNGQLKKYKNYIWSFNIL